MVNIGFLAKDGQGRVTISSSIPEEKKHRLNALPLYNPGFLKWLFILNLKKSQLDQSVENYPPFSGGNVRRFRRKEFFKI